MDAKISPCYLKGNLLADFDGGAIIFYSAANPDLALASINREQFLALVDYGKECFDLVPKPGFWSAPKNLDPAQLAALELEISTQQDFERWAKSKEPL